MIQHSMRSRCPPARDVAPVAPRVRVGLVFQSRRSHRSRRRGAFTLLELMLALALVVLATLLIGSLMQIFASNFATRGEDIRREQLALALLNMIAEDIRGVVLQQEYDASVLETLMGGSGSSGGSSSGGDSGGGDSSGGATGGDAASGESSEGGSGSYGSGNSSSGSSSSGGSSSGGSSSGGYSAGGYGAGGYGSGGYGMEVASVSSPPGIYGDQYTLMIDVSRVPRPDEYLFQQASLMDAALTDVPGDMKRVTYFVQAATSFGVQDGMSVFQTADQETVYPAGLVRRKLDRAVSAYAEEMAQMDRLMRTGDLLAPEVVSVEFAYFDGVQWLTQWDSSTQSLPWLVQITLAMQSASSNEVAAIDPGIAIGSLSMDQRTEYGIEVYQLIVAIPGAQLHAADAASAEQAAGMEGLGL